MQLPAPLVAGDAGRGVKVQELLGHSDTRVTQKYAKLDPRRVADEVAEIFDALALKRPRTERAARWLRYSASRVEHKRPLPRWVEYSHLG